MIFYHIEKFYRRHLERDCDILISIHHNDVILFINRLQISSSIIGCDRHILRQRKIFSGKVCDLLINLHSFDCHIAKILSALCRISSGSHAKDQYLHIRGCFVRNHKRRCHRVIIVHTGQTALFHVHRLHSEKDICGKYHTLVCLRHLQIVVNRFPFVGQVILPECKRI